MDANADSGSSADGGSDDPTARNRLDGEASPYLGQHADNPVNWQPWDDGALRAARERDVPIFLSVGYAACHWCHVMAEESFEDPAVAERLNESFVPVKVDREERPDLDSVYQTVARMVSGRGGWPLSVWLTPEGKPFYVGTYFPPEPRRGMPGFRDLLDRIADSWADPDDRAEMERRADQWTAAAVDELESTPAPIDSDDGSDDGDHPDGGDPGDGGAGPPVPGSGSVADVDTEADRSGLLAAADALVRGADREHGGFSTSGPKFPHPRRIDLLLRAHDRTGRDVYREVATETLDAMADGGMYDHLGGGFHRYATDRTWTVPHFEKMLYDNAELPRAYLAAYRLTGRESYARVARETFAFVDRELSHPEGGFFGTLDARSLPPESRRDGREDAGPATGDGGGSDADDDADPTGDAEPTPEEGAFYTWTPDELRAVLGEEADLVAARYGVTPGGNFEGTTVPTVDRSVADLAADSEFDGDERAIRDRLAEARERLRAAREDRPRPARDEKVIAGWNGLMVAALAEGAWTLDPSYADRAADALAFVREHLYDPETGRLARRYATTADGGDVKGEGYLEDYAFLGRGALDLYGVTGDPDHLGLALELAETIVNGFYDDDAGTLYFTPEFDGSDDPGDREGRDGSDDDRSGEGDGSEGDGPEGGGSDDATAAVASADDLVARPQELRDQSTPASLSVAVDLLAVLDGFVDGDRFGSVARRVARTHRSLVRSRPTEHVSLALAADRLATGSTELTIAADVAGEGVPEEWRRRLGERYLPAAVYAPRPATDAELREWLDELDCGAGPLWAGRDARGGPTAYVCRDRTCSPPLTDVADVLSWIDDLAPTVDRGADAGNQPFDG